MSEQQRSINGSLTASMPVSGSLQSGGTVNGWVGIPPMWDNIRTFDTVADMAAARDLKDGAVCHTLGFHSAGDGGASFYKMSESGTPNGMSIISCTGSGLCASLVITEPFVTPEQFGAYGDGTHDDLASINAAIASGSDVVTAHKHYVISDSIVLDNGGTNAYNANRMAPKVRFNGFLECVHESHPAVKLTNAYNDVYFEKIVAAIGIELNSDTLQCWHTVVRFGNIRATEYGIFLNATNYGILLNRIEGEIIRSNGICIYCKTGTKFITENQFDVHQVRELSSKPVGVKLEKTSSSDGEVNTNCFNNLSLEGTSGIVHVNAMAEYYSLRVTELSRRQWCVLSGKSGVYIQTAEIVEYGFADCSELEGYQYYPCEVECDMAAEDRRASVQRVNGMSNTAKSVRGFAVKPKRSMTRYVTGGSESFLCDYEGYTKKNDIVNCFDIASGNVVLAKQHYCSYGINDIYVKAGSGLTFPYVVKFDDGSDAFSISSAGTYRVLITSTATLVTKY
jgi:hypothetical protein